MNEEGIGTGMQITILQEILAQRLLQHPLGVLFRERQQGRPQLIRLPGVRQAAEQHGQPVILEEVDLLARRLAHATVQGVPRRLVGERQPLYPGEVITHPDAHPEVGNAGEQLPDTAALLGRLPHAVAQLGRLEHHYLVQAVDGHQVVPLRVLQQMHQLPQAGGLCLLQGQYRHNPGLGQVQF